MNKKIKLPELSTNLNKNLMCENKANDNFSVIEKNIQDITIGSEIKYK
jgi:hypothetical protein